MYVYPTAKGEHPINRKHHKHDTLYQGAALCSIIFAAGRGNQIVKTWYKDDIDLIFLIFIYFLYFMHFYLPFQDLWTPNSKTIV